MSDAKHQTFAELVGPTPEQLKQPASRKLLGQVVDHSAEAIRALTARIETLEQKLNDMEAKR